MCLHSSGLLMKTLPFKNSALVSIGVELEYQIINTHTFGLISRAKELIRDLKKTNYQNRIKPEITKSMIEVNTSIHTTPKTMLEELNDIKDFLLSQADKFDVLF